ncbi:UDP-glucose 4-epimerase [Velocimicrobium porci]|uniref:UDP-glucose 4-epimerase n=1 Tax=Velocimicrobium porci TaxID=2606634 RepID=UPI00197B78C5
MIPDSSEQRGTNTNKNYIEMDRRAGDSAVLITSIKKAKAILGWEPKHNSLKEIIQTAWVWHKNHPNGYKNV